MLKTLSKLNEAKFIRGLALFCIFFAIINASDSAIAASRRSPSSERSTSRRGRDTAGTGSQTQRRGQAAGSAVGDMDTKLVEMLTLINQGQHPNSEKIASAQQVLQKSRGFLKQFADNIVCQYFMLNAWVTYFATDAQTAVGPATQAYRKDNSNNDAHATQTAMAVLAGQKPLALRPKKEKTSGELSSRQQRPQARPSSLAAGRMGRPGRETGYDSTGSLGGTASSGNILNLDPGKVKADWLGQKISPSQFNCLNGTTFSCDPARANLSILFWKLAPAEPENASEPEVPDEVGLGVIRAPGGRPGVPDFHSAPRSRMRPLPGFDRSAFQAGRGAFDAGNLSADSFSSQMSAFADLFNLGFQDPALKFVAVNTDDSESKSEVMAKLLQSPWPWAQVMLNDNPGGIEQFAKFNLAGLSSTEPVLIIVDHTGTVKYAGPAEGFLAPLVLESLDRPASKTEIANDLQTTGNDTRQAFQEKTPEPMPEGADNANEEAQAQSEQDSELTPEDFQAQKLLEGAKTFLKIARFTTPKKGIDMCRQVMQDYPNTRYADEARRLLREQVPVKYRKIYNITNEEMGL